MSRAPAQPDGAAGPGGPGVAPAGPSLRVKALAYLALREHSTHELRVKLARWARARGRDAQAEGLEPLLAALQQAGHLSDARFAESRVHVRAPRLGNLRVEHELRRSGVEPEEALREVLRSTELDRARAVWARRFGRAQAATGDGPDRAEHPCCLDRREWARQARFLAARGFGAETIRRVLHGGEHEDLPEAAHAPDGP